MFISLLDSQAQALFGPCHDWHVMFRASHKKSEGFGNPVLDHYAKT